MSLRGAPLGPIQVGRRGSSKNQALPELKPLLFMDGFPKIYRYCKYTADRGSDINCLTDTGSDTDCLATTLRHDISVIPDFPGMRYNYLLQFSVVQCYVV